MSVLSKLLKLDSFLKQHLQVLHAPSAFLSLLRATEWHPKDILCWLLLLARTRTATPQKLGALMTSPRRAALFAYFLPA